MTQKEMVLQMLNKDGRVSRNRCIECGVYRLGAIMFDLKAEGVHFTTKETDSDFWYISDLEKGIVNEPSKKKAPKSKKTKVKVGF
jgi:hypothetical protein